MKHPHNAGILVVILLIASAFPAAAQDCSVIGQNTFVRDTLEDFYLWYRELPDADPALFDSPEAFLEAVRFRPIDNTFSFLSSRASTQAFFSNSQFIGVGFSFRQLGPEELRVSQVFPESPASEAGLTRGSYLLAIDGRPVADLIASGELGAALGPSEIGFTLELTWRSFAGEESTKRMTKRAVTIPTVSQTAVFDVNGLPVGYIHFRNFVEPSIAALDAAFAEFQRRGVVDLILDVRYNGGGLINVATHLASLIGGMRTNTQVFTEFRYNDKHPDLNRKERFEDPPRAIDAPRVVVITSRASASSSELVINGLEPFIPVTLVGRPTFGKPVGQLGFEFCDKALFPVSFSLVNARGEGEFFGGLPVDCVARDGLNKPLADPEEASLAEALFFLRNGTCSPQPEQTLQTLEPGRLYEPRGFRQVLNAW